MASKIKVDGSEKGRILVLGLGQVPSRDCRVTFFCSVDFEAPIGFLTIAARYNLKCWKLNYNNAFLDADFKEEVHVKTAPGYEKFDVNGVSIVMRRLRSLYGLP